MTYIITDYLREADTVSLGVWVKTGARNESKENNGISHFLEHMAFKGTTSRSAKEIAEAIENVGGIINAYTSREVTAYYVKLLKEDVNLGLDILADIYQNSTFIPEEMERERGVIIQEISQSLDTPEDVVYNNFNAICYKNQPMGRTILGDAKVVKAISRDDMVKYMKNNYTAERTAVSVSGKFDKEDLLPRITKAFGDLTDKKAKAPKPAVFNGGFFIKKTKHEQVNIVLGFKGVAFNDKHFYTSAILASVLGGGMSSRLFQEVREKHGLAYSIYSFSQSATDTGTFVVAAGTSKEDADKLVTVVAEELKKATSGITKEEFMRAKNQFKASLIMAREDSSTRCEQNARQMLLRGRTYSIDETLELIEAVKIKDMENYMASLLTTDLAFAALGPVDGLNDEEKIKAKFRI